jgi:hypothetical protein
MAGGLLRAAEFRVEKIADSIVDPSALTIKGDFGRCINGFRVPCLLRWPGHVPAGKVENDIMSGLDWFRFEFWRFVFVQQQVAKLAMTAMEYPPIQKGASFNLDAVKAKIEEAMKHHQE